MTTPKTIANHSEENMTRNMSARNFGLRSRDMGRALVTAYQMESGNGDNTKNNCQSALKDFSKDLKSQGIKDLRKVERENVLAYANSLNDRFERNEISASTAQNYMSKVNVAMEHARMDKRCRVEGVKEAGLPTRTGIALVDSSVSQQQHDTAKQSIPERLGVQLELQRYLGLRFKESSLIDAKSVLEHAEKTGIIKISDGTKGGRDREFPVAFQKQIDALKDAAEIQKGDRSMIPTELKWSQYQNQCNRDISKTNIRFHGERHHYATDRYENLAGVKCPVQAEVKHGTAHHQYMAEKLNISLNEARALDDNVRLKIAEELGHSRISITNNYLG